jgi:autotransporter-associated beta strand protein
MSVEKLPRHGNWRSKAVLSAAAGIGYLSLTSLSTAATFTWTHSDVSHNWSIAANWVSSDAGVAPPPPAVPAESTTTDLIFAGDWGTGTQSTQNTGTIEVNSITFGPFTSSNGTFSLSGSTTGEQYIYLGAGGLIGNATGTVAIQAGAARRIILTAHQTWSNSNTAQIISQRRSIEGAFTITKTGAGTIEFQADNNAWTGGLILNQGVIRLSNFSNALGTGPIVVNTANNVAFSASGSTQTDQTVAGAVTLGGTGSFGLGGSWNFAFSSPVTLLNDKTMSVSHIATFNTSIDGAGFTLTKTGGGTMLLTQPSTIAGFAVNNGTIEISNANQLGTGTGAIGLGSLNPGGPTITTGTIRALDNIDSTRDLSMPTGAIGAVDNNGFSVVFGNVSGGDAFNKIGDGSLVVKHVRTGSLSIAAGAVGIANNGGPTGTSVVKNLLIAGDATPMAKLDLDNNDLIIDYVAEAEASPLATVTAQIVAGRAGGAWNGNGIASSTAASDATKSLGVADNAELNLASFSGQTVDSSSVLVKFTYVGDADVNGQVDVADLGRLASNWQTATGWSGGDFDYSGFVDVADLGMLASNWQAGAGDPLGPSFAEALAAVGLPGAAVPEPMGAAALLIGAWSLKRLRRRSS